MLIGAAGFVDAIGYVVLGRTFVANMSGNTVTLGMYITDHHWTHALARACPIVMFVPGLVMGAMIVAAARRFNLRSCLAPALAVETLCLAAFLLVGLEWAGNRGKVHVTDGSAYPILVGLAAIAMGIQNGALRRVGALRNVHTYVTGMLLASADGLTDFILWVSGSSPKRGQPQCGRSWGAWWSQPGLRKAWVAGGFWAGYLVGAVVGASALIAYGLVVMLAPLLVLAVITAAEFFWPVHCDTPIAEEPESGAAS